MSMLTERVEGIQVYHDFDELDKNLTTLRKLNRDLNANFYAESKWGELRKN